MNVLEITTPDQLAPPPKRARILVVDDDPVNRLMIASLFEDEHEVVVADSAREAFAICRVTPPDILLMDIMMPDIDGLEACRRLKAAPDTKEIPVIFITAQGTAEEETEALMVGGVDFITKPVNPAVVRIRVRTQLTLKAQADFLRRMVFRDGLTGVANRRRFDEFLSNEWKRGSRNGSSLALIMVDIDHFKHFNDTYGHPAGDSCLCSVAEALNDTPKRPYDLVARYGGEEFACVLPDADETAGQRIAESLLAAVRDLSIPHSGSSTGIVTISAGVACVIAGSGSDPAALIAKADAKLYQAKGSGRNRVVS